MMLPLYDVAGPPEAPALVLLGSLGTTRHLWDAQLPALLPHFQVIRIEHPGHGGSPVDVPVPSSLEVIGTGVLGVLDHLEVARASLCGVSLGGMVAQWLAATAPSRVDRLVLACTATRLPPPEAWLTRAEAVRRDGVVALGAQLLGRWFTPDFLDRHPEKAAWVRRMLGEVDAEGYAACCEAIAHADLSAAVRSIEAPTAVLAGAADPVSTPSMAFELASAIAGASFSVLARASHLANVEQADRFTAVMLDHLVGPPAERGRAVRRAVLGEDHVKRSEEDSDPFAAAFVDMITRTAWGEVWVRPGLDRATRSALTLAILVVLGRLHELPLHVRGARRNGLRDDQILEVVLHSAVYGGVPAANAALAVVRRVLAELDSSGDQVASTEPPSRDRQHGDDARRHDHDG